MMYPATSTFSRTATGSGWASLRDENGDREVLSTNGGDYVVVECCNDRQQLQAIRHRIQGQMNGLDMSAAKVQGRIRVLERFIARFRKKE